MDAIEDVFGYPMYNNVCFLYDREIDAAAVKQKILAAMQGMKITRMTERQEQFSYKFLQVDLKGFDVFVPAVVFLVSIVVFVCRECDHGQVYCGEQCSKSARRSSERRAGAKYQASKRGRHNHAARQRKYVARQQGKKSEQTVTHHRLPDPGGRPHSASTTPPTAIAAVGKETPDVAVADHAQDHPLLSRSLDDGIAVRLDDGSCVREGWHLDYRGRPSTM